MVGNSELHTSEHDIAIALLISKWLWLPVQGLHRIGPDSIPSWAVPKRPPLLKNLVTASGQCGRERHFLQRYWQRYCYSCNNTLSLLL